MKTNIEERFKYCKGPQANNHVNGHAVMQLNTLDWVASHHARQYKLARSFKRTVDLSFQQKFAQVESGVNSGTQGNTNIICVHPVGSLTSPSLSICETKLQSARWRSCGACAATSMKFANRWRKCRPPVFPSRVSGLGIYTCSVHVFSPLLIWSLPLHAQRAGGVVVLVPLAVLALVLLQ